MPDGADRLFIAENEDNNAIREAADGDLYTIKEWDYDEEEEMKFRIPGGLEHVSISENAKATATATATEGQSNNGDDRVQSL